VLIVDDDPVVLTMLPSILTRRLPYVRIETCQSSRLAVQKASDGHYDAALVDLTMPELDGFTLLKHVREARPCTSILLMTGQNDGRTAERAFREGAVDFVAKPFDTQELALSVDLAVRTHLLRRRADERWVYLRRFRETLEQRWRKSASIVEQPVIDESRSLMRASLTHIEASVRSTERMIERMERLLRRRDDLVRWKARQRLHSFW